MRSAIGRVSVFVCALALVIASVTPVTAQSSDTVSVTGQIVAVPLSISISTTNVSFGNIDYKATAQTPTAVATGFPVPGGASGAQWVANSPVNVTIESPGAFTSNVCVSTHNGLPANLLYILGVMPGDNVAANTAFTSANAAITGACGAPTVWATGNSGVHVYSKYLGMWIQSTDQPQSFSATVTFTVAAG